jgi:hypothetical protein
MKIVKVNKINKESFNNLIDLGYKVVFVQTLSAQSPYIKYIYNRTINPKKQYFECIYECIKPGCNHTYSSACPETYSNI